MATPKGQGKNRLDLFGGGLPEIPLTERLHEIWLDLGQCAPGPAPFSWSEVEAYNRLAGADLTSVEAQCLVEMSRAFSALYADTNPLSIAPMERKHD